MPYNFAASTLATEIAHLDLPFDLIWDAQKLTTDGAINLTSGLVRITKGSAAAITLPVPDKDGQDLTIISESAFAHTVTTVSPGFNNNSSFTVITMAPVAGDVVRLASADGVWWVTKQGLNGNILANVQTISGDGAITIKNGAVLLTKGSAAAITIAAPTSGVDDGAEVTITTSTAFAHVVTQGTVGFNAKGASGTATWAAAKGNGITIVAIAGNWYVKSNIGVTIA